MNLQVPGIFLSSWRTTQSSVQGIQFVTHMSAWN